MVFYKFLGIEYVEIFFRASLLILVVIPGFAKSDPTIFQATLEGTGNYNSYGPKKRPSVIWSFETYAPLISTPLVFEESVYLVDLEGTLYALQETSGDLIWKKDLDGQPGFQITLDESVLLVSVSLLDESDSSYLLALDRLTGDEIWRFELTGQASLEAPVVYGDKVYFTSMSDYLFSIDINTGEELWRFATKGGGQPLISDDILYIEDDSQVLYALSSGDGEEYWRENSQSIQFSDSGVPAISNCCILTVREKDDNWFLVEIDKNNGEVNNEIILNYPTVSPISLVDNVVFFGDEGEGHSDAHAYMNAIDTVTGKWVWRYETEGFIRAAASISDNVVYFGSHDQSMYAVDIRTGELKWRYETNAGIASSPAIVNGRIYFGNIEGSFYVLE